jgi:hypothetical protein
VRYGLSHNLVLFAHAAALRHHTQEQGLTRDKGPNARWHLLAEIRHGGQSGQIQNRAGLAIAGHDHGAQAPVAAPARPTARSTMRSTALSPCKAKPEVRSPSVTRSRKWGRSGEWPSAGRQD